jgi:hypothetical protein
MSKWILVVLLGLQAHFAASYLVPLDERSQREFGGLLRWFWPWAYGDGGPLGRITPESGFPIAGFFVAVTGGGLLLLAALAAAGIWVPAGWWRALTTAGAVLLVCLTALFFGPTKVIPLAFALGTLYVALCRPAAFAVG